MTNRPPQALGFTDISGRMQAAASEISRFAILTQNGPMAGGNLIYRVVVDAGRGLSIAIDAHALPVNWFGVCARLTAGAISSAPEKVWMLTDVTRWSSPQSEPALCIRCLKKCTATTCEHKNVPIDRIPISRFKQELTHWTRSVLPEDALRRNRTKH